jgi:hypothetical protein
MPAVLDGAAERLRGAGCWAWAVDFYLHAHTALALKAMAKADCNDFDKKMY